MKWLPETARPLRPGGLAARLLGGHTWLDGRVDDSPVVVLLHGSGALGDDLVPLAEMLSVPRAVRFALPVAPLPLPGAWINRRGWWPLDLDRHAALLAGPPDRMMEEDPPGLDAACGAVAELLDALEPVVGVPPERVLLGGFSRGAVVATEVALRGGRPLAGLLLFSPTFARAALWRSLMRSRPALPVFMAHGRRDTFHPLALAEALRDELAAAGHTVDWVDFEDGHAVAPVAVARASVFVRRAVERWT